MSSIRGFMNGIALKKTAGTNSAISVGTQINIPTVNLDPSNPENKRYMATINRYLGITNATQGKKTPAFALSTIMKSSWFTANLVKSLLFGAATTDDSDEYSMGVYAPEASGIERIYDGGKCVGITTTQLASGEVGVQMAFVAKAGTDDGVYSSSTTFTTPTPDKGMFIPVNQVSWANATQVMGHTLNLFRPQGYIFTNNQTLYAEFIKSGVFTGSLSVTQLSNASTIIGNSTTAAADTLSYGTTGAGVAFAMTLQLDNRSEREQAAIKSITRTYSMADIDPTGVGSLVTISAL